MTAVIQAQKLTKSYGPFRGIVDVDLEVNEGAYGGRHGKDAIAAASASYRAPAARLEGDSRERVQGQAQATDHQDGGDQLVVREAVARVEDEVAQALELEARARSGVRHARLDAAAGEA